MNRIETIKTRLIDAFSPTICDVIDDSDQHIGHAGSQNGAGHFTIKIQAAVFAGKSRVIIHREIYQVLIDLMPETIHALRILLV